jgi:HAD superfamily hydrolase (TIGR01549 family)
MEKQNTVKAALFDFDKTIVFLPTDYDSVRSRLNTLFAELGVFSDFSPLIDSVNYLLVKLKRMGKSQSVVDHVKDKAFAIIEDEELKAVKYCRPAENAKDILSLLKESNVVVAIVSRNGKKCIAECFSILGLPDVDLIVAREDTDRLKPHSRHFEITLRKLGVYPFEAIVVGDSYHDIEGAQTLRIPSVLVKAYDDEQAVDLVQPDYRISSLIELRSIIGI